MERLKQRQNNVKTSIDALRKYETVKCHSRCQSDNLGLQTWLEGNDGDQSQR